MTTALVEYKFLITSLYGARERAKSCGGELSQDAEANYAAELADLWADLSLDERIEVELFTDDFKNLRNL
jgi:hypothetical protein